MRDQYVMKLAGALDIDADRLRDAVARAPRTAAVSRVRHVAITPATTACRRPPSRPRRVDRRELDVLLYAVHAPELVADWLDARLFSDPIARDAFEAIAESADFHDALANTDGPVHDLLDRIAVEEPIASDEPETLARAPDGEHDRTRRKTRQEGMLRAGDERSSTVKLLLDALAHARATWATGRLCRSTRPSC